MWGEREMGGRKIKLRKKRGKGSKGGDKVRKIG